MPQIPVKTANSQRRVLNHLVKLMKSVHQQIRARAFQQQHGEGHELEYWLAAERDVLYSPPCILTETQDEIHLQTTAPCVDTKSLQVDVMPHSITIEGRMLKTTEARQSTVVSSAESSSYDTLTCLRGSTQNTPKPHWRMEY